MGFHKSRDCAGKTSSTNGTKYCEVNELLFWQIVNWSLTEYQQCLSLILFTVVSVEALATIAEVLHDFLQLFQGITRVV